MKRGDTVRYTVGGSDIAAWVVDPEGPIIRMVGDDRDFECDISDIELIEPEEFCGSCGQIGCGHG